MKNEKKNWKTKIKDLKIKIKKKLEIFFKKKKILIIIIYVQKQVISGKKQFQWIIFMMIKNKIKSIYLIKLLIWQQPKITYFIAGVCS